MEASQHSLLAACFTLHSINATLAIVPQRGAGLWIFFPCIFLLNIHNSSYSIPETSLMVHHHETITKWTEVHLLLDP
jgi:hypothetical protein